MVPLYSTSAGVPCVEERRNETCTLSSYCEAVADSLPVDLLCGDTSSGGYALMAAPLSGEDIPPK